MPSIRSTHKDSRYSSSQQAKKALSVLPSEERLLTKVQRRTKRGPEENWLDPEKLLTPAQAKTRIDEGGNYGFRLGLETEQGRMLAVLDVEESGVLPDSLNEWADKYSHLNWKSPHGGLNRLLMVTPTAYDILRGSPGKIDLNEDGQHELELLTPSRGHALGPGSIIDHQYCSEKKPCSGDGQDDYRFESRNSEADIVDETAAKQLLTLLEVSSVPESTEPGSESAKQNPRRNDEIQNLGKTVRRRLRRAEEFKFGDQFTALKEGRYHDAGFGNDRSIAEFRLAEILGWLFDDDEDIVHRTMTMICQQKPQTSAGLRKWLERNGRYRTLTISAACQHDSTYQPPSGTSPRGYRPTVSHVTVSRVFEAILELKLASTTTIAEHQVVDRSERQVQRAIKKHLEDDRVRCVRDGRKILYYYRKEFVPKEKRERYGL